jgi:hypothetical protein
MGKNGDTDFDSLFGDKPADSGAGADFDALFDAEPAAEKPKPAEPDFDFSLPGEDEIPGERRAPAGQKTPRDPVPVERRRSADDFQPDMDTLLITAQSSMIIEGIKKLSDVDFSSSSLTTYAEAVKGVELYIKIIQRNPDSYRKLSAIISSDMDCSEVERVAFGIYKIKHHDPPETNMEKLQAYQYLKEKLKNGYKKAMISRSMTSIKQYFLLSGGIDQDKLAALISNNDPAFKTDIARLNQNIQIAVDLLEKGDSEITKGLRGRDTNVYTIKVSQLLYFYYHSTGDAKTAEYYKRLYQNYKRYNIIK